MVPGAVSIEGFVRPQQEEVGVGEVEHVKTLHLMWMWILKDIQSKLLH